MRHDGKCEILCEFSLYCSILPPLLLQHVVCFVVVSLPSSSGADVLGGDASPQRDDGGQVRFLPH